MGLQTSDKLDRKTVQKVVIDEAKDMHHYDEQEVASKPEKDEVELQTDSQYADASDVDEMDLDKDEIDAVNDTTNEHEDEQKSECMGTRSDTNEDGDTKIRLRGSCKGDGAKHTKIRQ